MFLPALILALLSALALAAGGREPGPRTAALRRLVRYLDHGAPREAAENAFARADRYLLRWAPGAVLERRLRQAGVPAPVSALLLVTAAAASALAVAAAACWGPGAGPAAAVAVLPAAHALLQTARNRRLRRIEAQLPSALDMLVGQLKSHRSVGEAVADVAQWIGEPLRSECARVAEELRIGIPLARALERFRDRIAVPAAPVIVTAIVVAERTGANLAECLARQAATIRAHIAFRQEVRAMTAHARATGALLALLPAGVAGAMVLLDPGAFAPMVGTAPGRVLLGAAAAMEVCGWQAVRWMIRRVEP